MKTKTITLYDFKELSESAKQKAIEKLYDINIDYEWYDSTYEDAKNIGLKITGFDIDRARYCNGNFIKDANYTANKIKSEHGVNCETYKTADTFLQNWDKLVAKYSDGDGEKVLPENEYKFDTEADELEDEFLKSILEDYRIILSKEYDYLTSKAAIIETINANEYTFTEDGTLENI